MFVDTATECDQRCLLEKLVFRLTIFVHQLEEDVRQDLDPDGKVREAGRLVAQLTPHVEPLLKVHLGDVEGLEPLECLFPRDHGLFHSCFLIYTIIAKFISVYNVYSQFMKICGNASRQL